MIKIFNRGKQTICLLMLCFLFGLEADGQQKRILTPDDYKSWSNLQNASMTTNGNWVSYQIAYKDLKKDTLYLKNTINDKSYNFPSSIMGTFSPDNNWFACIKKDSLQLLNLRSEKIDYSMGISGFMFTSGSRYILSIGKGERQSSSTLWLKSLKTLETVTIRNVQEYSLSPDKNILGLVIKENGVNVVKAVTLNASLNNEVLASNSQFDYSRLTWNLTGKALAFYEQLVIDKEKPLVQKVYICRSMLTKPDIQILDPLEVIFPKGYYIELAKLYISDDSKQLFLSLHPLLNNQKQNNNDRDVVQIWHPDDKEVPPSNQRQLDTKWYAWWIDNAKMLPVEDKKHPVAVLTGDQKKALVYSYTDYLPQHDYVGNYFDLYIKDLWTGTKKLISKKQINEYRHVTVSPAGKYILYYKDKSWWSYDIYNDTHRCITAGLSIEFEDSEYDMSGAKPPYGTPGWINDDSYVIIYDQFDIWLIKPDGSSRLRITNGRNTNTTYRIGSNNELRRFIRDADFYFVADSFSAIDGILISSLNNTDLKQGYSFWDKKSGLVDLVPKRDRKLYVFPASVYKKVFLYTESDFNISPRLLLMKSSGATQFIYQSNPQQKDFHWGKSELVYYNTSDGKKLKSVLIYPADYVTGKKYPMITFIYQRQASNLHNYFPPSYGSEIGFNPTIYSQNGYFVLYPDIVYELNNPGISAARCVVGAVDEVLKRGLVDKDKIGLYGHSYGGYETSFIISQTNVFKAAIAGAAVTDLLGFYTSIGGYGKSNIFRFENQQFRIQSPFYGNDFINNSPIMNVKSINTPLLLWTGEKDMIVDAAQSIRLQIALWRLHKKSTLLVYPDENHSLMNPKYTADLTLRIKNWFDYYLKDEKPAEWIINKK